MRFIIAAFSCVALFACIDNGDPPPQEEAFSTVESAIMADCMHDGGCTTWDAQNGCTQVTCCTVCSSGAWACANYATLGGESCVFFPGAQ